MKEAKEFKRNDETKQNKTTYGRKMGEDTVILRSPVNGFRYM